MLTKFETESDRVYGLTFHPTRPWILASLRSGVIQLWDHRMGALIEKFEEHEGPVRGVHFHCSEPLFVSGGDDNNIKVWNHKTRSCLFTLLGHTNYIRTVQFHHQTPWIVSASDDMTIRIWNWQSRTCISVLDDDHSDSVMSASFHPIEDLLVSASLDKSVFVWDIGALRENENKSPILKQSLTTGHVRGVNWASFHPTKTHIVSAARDSQVTLWRQHEFIETWKVNETWKGHCNTVSCASFQEVYLSDRRVTQVVSVSSRDNSIRVWDMSGEEKHQSFCCGHHERFWTLAVHPEINLLAAGHDSGMIVFKLGRERPAFVMSGDFLLYAKDRCLYRYDFTTKAQLQVRSKRMSKWNQSPRTLSYSPTKRAVIICSDNEYELDIMPSEEIFWEYPRRRGMTGTGSWAVFINHEEFAVLVDKGHLEVKKLDNVRCHSCTLPFPTYSIFYAGIGKVLCGTEGKAAIIDLNKDGCVIAEIETMQQRRDLGGERQTTTFVRNVVWSKDMESVALLCKHTIIVASEKLVHQCTLDETKSVKSGAWDEDNGVFIYTTLSHLKYGLPNGETGIVKTLDVPCYITKVTANNIFCLDRLGKVRIITIDATEYIVKLSLLRKEYNHVMSMMEKSNLCGVAMIPYLKQKGYPGDVLGLAEDERTRFNLALESGKMDAAAKSAKEIDDKDIWKSLAVKALCHGKVEIAKHAYTQIGNFEGLSFLHLITGDLEKLSELMKSEELKNNIMGQLQNAFYLGDVESRVNILENNGHVRLAYITASVHGLNDIADRLATQLGEDVPSLPEGKTPSLLMPPKPVIPCGRDWPRMTDLSGDLAGDKQTEREECSSVAP